MERKNRYILSIGMLLINVYAPLVVHGTEIHSLETEGTIGFTGVYETPGTSEPAPEGAIKPDLPKEIAQHTSRVSHSIARRLPKTNESQKRIWLTSGFFLVSTILGFWFWRHKQKKNK
ncbi:LPXTG cell wall anchor domain-containing protein [Enterococcus spodopteracolus]|uniref:LPXTG cell wall anchor domain-containing protein n=1 Tax=Enterococcus spodopteracolus TaxID=3034501 RepID=UPI002649493F|nr:LPXTG cell wall anchor domain-containing protein [Enterococcus spodopteracolus]